MTTKQLGALLLLSAMWGGSFLFMRIAATVLGPILLIFLRVLIAGVVLLGYTALQRRPFGLRRYWREYLVIGVLNSAIPFLLISFASLSLPASVTATLNATTPLFGAVVAVIWTGERLTLPRVGGLALGFLGVVILVGLGPIPLEPSTLVAAGASLVAALCYGIAAVYTRVKVQGADPQMVATFSQLGAAVAIVPLLPWAIPSGAPSGVVVGSLLALALICTAVAYLIFFYLILNAGPTKATLVTYLAPAFGMLWGALILGERLAPGNFVGFGLILFSLILVSGLLGRPRVVRTLG